MNTLKLYWRTIFIFLVIVFLSLMNVNKVMPDNIHFHKHFDKFVHFIMYFTLSFIFFIENYNSIKPLRKRWIIIDTILLGIILEFIQMIFTQNRTGNIYDAIFNTIGVIAGSILYLYLRDKKFIYYILLFKKAYNK